MILLPLNEKMPDAAERARRTTPVRGTERFGRVLDQRHAVLGAVGSDHVVVGALPVQVDHDDRGRQATSGGALAQFVGEQLRTHVPRDRLAVDEAGSSAEVGHCIRRCREGEARNQYIVARGHAAASAVPGAALRCRSTGRPRRPIPSARPRSRSNPSRSGPTGAIQPSSNARSSAARSSSPTSGELEEDPIAHVRIRRRGRLPASRRTSGSGRRTSTAAAPAGRPPRG